MTNLLAQAQEAVKNELVDDQTLDTGGNFDYAPPPEGPAMARLISYIELGKRKQKPYQGKEKPDCMEARLVFELFGKNYNTTTEVDGKTVTAHPIISMKITVKQGAKANFGKLLKAMTYGRADITHMATMLGEAFLVHIVHNKVGEGKEQKVYANLRDDSGWKIGAPVKSDPLSGETTLLPVPEPTHNIQLLLWNSPTVEQWASIFIDGTRTVRDDKGVETEQSNNWLQNQIIEEATNFAGSGIEALLLANDGFELDGGEKSASAPTEQPPESDEQEKPADVPAADESDPLADLGL